ncbi:hypothetical protein [Sphingobium soli]|nr:hypothetical protein [Sphingobium soli]|tara:strand:- start:2067 stop:2198 length:132 start_codon:yes stop_codon:yes gene_type:complete
MDDDKKSKDKHSDPLRKQDADEVQEVAEDGNPLAPSVNVEPGS